MHRTLLPGASGTICLLSALLGASEERGAGGQSSVCSPADIHIPPLPKLTD